MCVSWSSRQSCSGTYAARLTTIIAVGRLCNSEAVEPTEVYDLSHAPHVFINNACRCNHTLLCMAQGYMVLQYVR